MINSRSFDHLDPEAREVCLQHVLICRDAGIEIIVTSTWRDHEAQAALYAIGRTVHKERRTVTKAKAGQSWHQYKCAWDVVPIVGGKCVWDAKDPLWREVVKLGKECGAEAGADWQSFPDLPHFQFVPTVQGLHINIEEAADRWKDRGTIFTA